MSDSNLIKGKSKVINIHGNIDNLMDVIFGYGDENSKEYKEIENSEDIFLENIKSFKYLKNENYDNLREFIEGRIYEVYILGHSCSVTDRILLKKVFENKNCISIKIIPRNGDENTRLENYRQISFNIARNFDDNGLMRDKVIPFESSNLTLPNLERLKVKVSYYIKSKITKLKTDCLNTTFVKYKVFDKITNSYTEIEITPSEYGGFDMLFFDISIRYKDYEELALGIMERCEIIELIEQKFL